jgi:hypothetical protein
VNGYHVENRPYASSYKDIKQGDTESHMIEMLGCPDTIRTTQAVGFKFADYEKGAIEIAVWNGRVFQIRRVPLGKLRMPQEAEKVAGGK